jgi:general secretion pathway protein I
MTACKYTLPNKKGRNTHGFTLLEVMLAMAILAIALVAVFQSQSQSISMTNISRFATTAPLLAQSKMAEIEGMDPKNIGSGNGDFGDNFPDYSWRADVMETEISSFKKIEVTVINEKMVSNNSYQLVLYKFIAK